jgi:hypothetical protein
MAPFQRHSAQIVCSKLQVRAQTVIAGAALWPVLFYHSFNDVLRFDDFLSGLCQNIKEFIGIIGAKRRPLTEQAGGLGAVFRREGQTEIENP